MPVVLKNIPELSEATALNDSDVTIVGDSFIDPIYKRNLGSIANNIVASNKDAKAHIVKVQKLRDSANVLTSMDLPEIMTQWHAPFFPNRAAGTMTTDFDCGLIVEWQTWHTIPYKYIEEDQGGVIRNYPELFTDRAIGLVGGAFRLPLINPAIAPVSIYYISAYLSFLPIYSARNDMRFRMYIGVFEGEPGTPPAQIWSTRIREFWIKYLYAGSQFGIGDTAMYFEYNRASGPHHWVVPFVTLNISPVAICDTTGSKFSLVKMN